MRDNTTQHVALDLTCLECGVSWLDASERWRIYLTDDDCPEPVLYCQVCATREFD